MAVPDTGASGPPLAGGGESVALSPADLAAEHAALRRVAMAVARGTDPAAVFDMVAAQVRAVFHAQAGVVWRFEAGHYVAAGASGHATPPPGTRFPLTGAGAVPTVARTARPARTDYRALDPGDPAAGMRSVGFRFGVAAPIVTAGRLWGAVLAARTADQRFEPGAAERLGHFAEFLALGIADADARRAGARLLADEAAITRLAKAIARGVPQRELLGLVAEEAATLLELEVGGVGRYGPDAVELVASWSVDGSGTPGGGRLDRIPLAADTVLGRVHRRRAACRVEDYGAIDDPVARSIAELPIRSSVAAPIRVDDVLWGVVAATSPRASALAPDAEARLTRLAELAGLAVASAAEREELTRRAATDPLTGLANRRTFRERLAQEVERALRHGRPLALVLFDVDRFKDVNDRLGHVAGDRALTEVARRIAAQSRPEDLLARVGGEEFAWLLPEADEDAAYRAAERARAAVRDGVVEGVGEVTVSAGVSELGGAAHAARLFEAADRALYAAKAAGRDRSRRHSTEPGARPPHG